MKVKILNLYACLGGNRYKWDEVADVEVTAVELDPELSRMYQERFPNDTVIATDAHQYLLDHYKEYDIIWSSPPCPSHSKTMWVWNNTSNSNVGNKSIYPDMNLYQEIIFLESFFKGKYIVENVIPYYDPLITAQKRGRHLYWANFKLPININERKEATGIVGGNVKKETKKLEAFHKIDLSSYKGSQRKDKIARNLVDYEAGKTILETALNIITKSNTEQTELFTNSSG
tara:strand:- start:6837 stop:7526 length:690 start_codon:yes stop_codon:yes gene_type:complete